MVTFDRAENLVTPLEYETVNETVLAVQREGRSATGITELDRVLEPEVTVEVTNRSQLPQSTGALLPQQLMTELRIARTALEQPPTGPLLIGIYQVRPPETLLDHLDLPLPRVVDRLYDPH